MHCPKCDADISDSFERADPSIGIDAGWYCDACDHAIAEWEAPREPMEGDVGIGPLRQPGEPIGTPISQLSGRPGEPGYAEFCRIARSYGYE